MPTISKNINRLMKFKIRQAHKYPMPIYNPRNLSRKHSTSKSMRANTTHLTQNIMEAPKPNQNPNSNNLLDFPESSSQSQHIHRTSFPIRHTHMERKRKLS